VIGGVNFFDIPLNIWNGAKCFVGIATYADDNCHWAFVPIFGYTLANFLFNLLSLYILKNLSSAIVYIQNTVRLPLVAIAFHLELIMGKDVILWSTDDFYTFGGLVVIIAGLGIYMKDAIVKSGKKSKPIPPLNENNTLLPSTRDIDIYYRSAPLPLRRNEYDSLEIDNVDFGSIIMG